MADPKDTLSIQETHTNLITCVNASFRDGRAILPRPLTRMQLLVRLIEVWSAICSGSFLPSSSFYTGQVLNVSRSQVAYYVPLETCSAMSISSRDIGGSGHVCAMHMVNSYRRPG